MAKGLLAILGKEPEGEEDLDGEAKRQAAQDLASAVKGGDSGAIVDAFQRMYDLCSGSSSDDESDDDY